MELFYGTRSSPCPSLSPSGGWPGYYSFQILLLNPLSPFRSPILIPPIIPLSSSSSGPDNKSEWRFHSVSVASSPPLLLNRPPFHHARRSLQNNNNYALKPTKATALVIISLGGAASTSVDCGASPPPESWKNNKKVIFWSTAEMDFMPFPNVV